MAPEKFVRWNMGSPSNLDSPGTSDIDESYMSSTSSLEYVNSQLIAHGFIPPPGLRLTGASDENSSQVVKCLLGLLSQRIEDMSRMEELTARYRTTSYDLERMRSMHGSEMEKAANAEREIHLNKARLAASLRSLQASESVQKQTALDLQRTRTLLQGIRASTQAELRKKEKESERIVERWQKIADLQAKLGATQSGIKCANATVVDGVQAVGKGQGFLDIALEQAEQARSHLSDENLFLRKLVLKAVNELHSLLHKARRIFSGNCTTEEKTSFTMTAFFVPSSPSAANDELNGVIDSLDSTLTSLQEAQTAMPASSHKSGPSIPEDEIEKLHGIITKLKEELASSQKQTLSHMTEAQAMFDKFAEDHHSTTGEIREMSVELLSVPLRDEAKERLEDLRNELDSERQRFTEAAVKFGKEKAALETERIRFLEEKRAWEVEKILADLPATPGSSASHEVVPSVRQAFFPKKSPRKPPHKSPRKSPAKAIPVGKLNNSRKSRHLLRTSLALPTNIISYETELIPPLLPTSKPSASSKSSLLPSSFVLPPPSPRASLPDQPALPPARLDVLPEPNHKSTDIIDYLPPTVDIHSPPNDQTPVAPRRPFPVAKPFAQRMFHAYSPAKPSPLSRILMLADSPVTPPNAELQVDISQSATSISSEGSSLERAIMGIPAVSVPKPPTFLAPEPQYDALNAATKGAPPVQTGFSNLDSKKHQRIAESNVRSRTAPIGEKENRNSIRPKVFSKPTSAGATGDTTRKVSPTTGGTKATTKSVKGAVGAKTANLIPKEKPISNPSVSRGGPRRVLINSADAPVIGKAWKS